MRAGPWETVLKTPYRHLGEPEAPAQRNVSIRLQSLLGLPFCSGALARCSLKHVPVSSYLAVFAVEIIDLVFHIRHLILQTSPFLAVLLQLEQHITQPILEVIAIGLLLHPPGFLLSAPGPPGFVVSALRWK